MISSAHRSDRYGFNVPHFRSTSHPDHRHRVGVRLASEGASIGSAGSRHPDHSATILPRPSAALRRALAVPAWCAGRAPIRESTAPRPCASGGPRSARPRRKPHPPPRRGCGPARAPGCSWRTGRRAAGAGGHDQAGGAGRAAKRAGFTLGPLAHRVRARRSPAHRERGGTRQGGPGAVAVTENGAGSVTSESGALGPGALQPPASERRKAMRSRAPSGSPEKLA